MADKTKKGSKYATLSLVEKELGRISKRLGDHDMEQDVDDGTPSSVHSPNHDVTRPFNHNAHLQLYGNIPSSSALATQPSPSPDINGASIEMMDATASPNAPTNVTSTNMAPTNMAPTNMASTNAESPRVESVATIFHSLDRIESIDADYIAMQQMIEVEPPPNTAATHSRYVSSPSTTAPVHHHIPHSTRTTTSPPDEEYGNTEHDDPDGLRSKHIVTARLRRDNEQLAQSVQALEERVEELQASMVAQRDTIVRQNRHLLTLQSERDDFADTVEEQKEEKRMSVRLSLHNALSYRSDVQLPMGPMGGPMGGQQHEDGVHGRSVTTPQLTPLAVSEVMGVLPDENEDAFYENEEFKLLEDGNEDEEKLVMDMTSMTTPGGPDDMMTDSTPGGPSGNPYNSGHSGQSGHSSPSNKHPKFVLVDDITADVERRYTSKSRTVLHSQIDPHRVEQLWSGIVGPHLDDESILEESAEICDAWTIDECQCAHRLLFVLKYYSQWLNHKSTTHRGGRRREHKGKKLPNVPEQNSKRRGRGGDHGFCDSIYEFVSSELKLYSHVQLLNDFYHVKQYHISDKNLRESVFTYFVNEFGFCDVKHCSSFRRNHREKSFFGHHNRFRRKMYHLDRDRISDMNEYDEHGDNEYELWEIGMQQCLDMLHSTLIHDHHNTTTDDLSEFARHLLKSPVPNDEDVEYSYSGHAPPHHAHTNTHTQTGTSTVAMLKAKSASMSPLPATRTALKGNNLSLDQFGSYRDRDRPPSRIAGDAFSGMNHMALASSSSIHSPSSPGIPGDDVLSHGHHYGGIHHHATPSPLIPIPRSPQRLDPESATQDLFVFGFGVRFSYWVPEWPDYVAPQFDDLRGELLENDLYRISPLEWDLLSHRAAMFKGTDHWRRIYVAHHRGSGNALMRIAAGSHLTTQHLIALFSYANYPNLRISFQKACLRTTPTETFVEVRSRHQQIANWARLLYEAVYLFGAKMTQCQSFYHIMRSKIMLREFSANLSCPTTMIANRKIVSHSNIVMQVKNANSRGATYLDLSCFSDVPNREERLFFFGDLAIDNIILKGKSHRHFIKSLSLFQKLVQGSYFYHLSLRKREYQSTVVHFMQNMLRSKDRGGVSNYVEMLRPRKRYNDEDIIDDNGVPLYMQHLFDYFCSNLKTLWINPEEFCRLEPDVARYLARTTDTMSSVASMQEMMAHSRSRQSLMGAFSKFLHFEYSVNLKNCCTLRWEISGNALRNFWRGQKVFGQEFRVSTIRLFPYAVKDSAKDDGQFRFGIPVKSMPKYLRKIEFRVDLYIKEIEYTFSAYTIIDDRGTYFYSLFDSSLLRCFERFTLRISFRLINLVVDNGTGVQSAGRNKGSFSSPPSRSLSLFKLEQFRKNSGRSIGSVRHRISSKLRKSNAITDSY